MDLTDAAYELEKLRERAVEIRAQMRYPSPFAEIEVDRAIQAMDRAREQVLAEARQHMPDAAARMGRE